MFFNSIDFAVFLPVVFVLYWFVANRNLKLQNVLIVCASYFFYAWWDWRFLGLILFSTLVDYTVGIKLGSTDGPKRRKLLLWVSIFTNLGFLGFFKYYNFFLDNFTELFTILGREINTGSLNVILPVGISFYTFQTLSYTIDVYREKLTPTRDFIAFASFVSFFPQLVAGPIERATHLLPQFSRSRTFSYPNAVDGLRQILWGLFKKMVIADNCAKFVNLIFDHHTEYQGSTLALGAVLFGLQIYCDFSGYSDVAIGASRLFGFNLKQNFAFPYFSRDMAEFWRRWHISLSTWFKDYLYIPLGGSREGPWMNIRNVFIVFIVSGFWHGANWTFIIWGALNALYFLPLLLTNRNRNHLDMVASDRYLPSLKEVAQMTITFGLTSLAWVFFRAESLSHAVAYLNEMLSPSLASLPEVRPRYLFLLIIVFVIVEWLGRTGEHALAKLNEHTNKPIRFALYYIIVIVIFWFSGEEQEFIYFQF